MSASPSPSPSPSPYAAELNALGSALEATGFRAEVTADAGAVTVWLPTAGGHPLASSPLIAPRPEPGPLEPEPLPTLAPWTVAAVPLSPAETLELLLAGGDREVLAPGILVGPDLAFWVRAMRFAGRLVVTERFVPSIRKLEAPRPLYRACWEPVIGGPDRQELRALSEAMPAVARLTWSGVDGAELGAQGPPGMSATDVVAAFVAKMVDHLVRTSLRIHSAARRAGAGTGAGIHEQWLAALRSPDGLLPVDRTGSLETFAAQVMEWHRPATLTLGSPFRLLFRLEEPAENGADSETEGESDSESGPTDAGWTLRYLLQSAADPSLLIPVEEAWHPSRATARLFAGAGFNAVEYLLRALGQAARIDPGIEGSLRTARPGAHGLDAAGVYEFLTSTAPALEQAGFGVLLPAWWTGKGTKLHLTGRARVHSPSASPPGGRLTLDSLVKVDWELALGDERLSLAELSALAELKQPLVKLRGQWVLVSPEEIQAALAWWQGKRASDNVPLSQVVRLALGQEGGIAIGGAGGGAGVGAQAGVPTGGLEADGWVADFLSQLQGSQAFEELEQPEGFRGALRPYQRRGYSWLAFLRRWGLGACLADDMGLGKTVQTLAQIQRDWMAGNAADAADAAARHPVLLICPTSVVGNWQREAARFAPELPVMVHHGPQRLRDGAAFREAAAGQAIVLSSYALLDRDQTLFQEVPWAGVILDEAQNIKNPKTKQARAARALRAEYRVALTGTPVENSVGDLWSIMEFLNPGLLGNQADFRRRFFVPIQVSRDTEAASRLKRLTAPFVLRRLKTDPSIISDLPARVETTVYSPLSKEQASLYQAVVNETLRALDSVDGMERRGLVLATLSKLKQICNHPAQFLKDGSAAGLAAAAGPAAPGGASRSGKLIRLTEMMEEALAAGDRVLVFTQFAEMGRILQGHLEEAFGHEVLFLHGGVSKGRRDDMISRFQGGGSNGDGRDGGGSGGEGYRRDGLLDDGRRRDRHGSDGHGPRILVLTTKAGGTGLNLTAANHVFLFDRWWNPAVENQAMDRAFRIGQTKTVYVHKFVCQGTLEERIDDLIKAKREMADLVVGTGEAWLTELSTGQLREIFALSREAVEAEEVEP